MKKTIITTTVFALLATGLIFSCKKKIPQRPMKPLQQQVALQQVQQAVQ